MYIEERIFNILEVTNIMLLYIISHLLYTFIILSFLSNNKVRFILYDKFFYNVLIWSGYTDCE